MHDARQMLLFEPSSAGRLDALALMRRAGLLALLDRQKCPKARGLPASLEDRRHASVRHPNSPLSATQTWVPFPSDLLAFYGSAG